MLMILAVGTFGHAVGGRVCGVAQDTVTVSVDHAGDLFDGLRRRRGWRAYLTFTSTGVRGGFRYADTRLSCPPGPIAATPNT